MVRTNNVSQIETSLFSCPQDLELFLANMDPRITLVRARNRLGLISDRALGAEYATSDVLIFLDSHCEVMMMI